MLDMTHHITINNKKVLRLLSAEIEKSAEVLSDKATLQLPAQVAGRAIEVEKEMYATLPVTIALGYNGQNTQEFAGYIASTQIRDGILYLFCEDSMYTLRKAVKNVQLKKVTAPQVVEQVTSEVAPNVSVLAGEGTKDIVFETFTIQEATAWEVLKKLKEQTGITIYMREQTLYLSLRYFSDKATAEQPPLVYDFTRNVEKSQLKYLKEEERQVQVKVTGIGKDNQRVSVTAGKPGQDSFSLNRYNITDKKALQRIAEEELKKWSYTGYEGSLTSWLTPYATYGMRAKIIDTKYPEREGTYFINSVRTTFDQHGGRRVLSLGKKVA